MTRQTPSVETKTDELHHHFLQRMKGLQKSIFGSSETAALEAWHEARKLVDALPLPTDQYDRVVARLKNCRRYLISSEYGAAIYELKLLVGALELRRSESTQPNRQPIRRPTPVVFETLEEFAVGQ